MNRSRPPAVATSVAQTGDRTRYSTEKKRQYLGRGDRTVRKIVGVPNVVRVVVLEGHERDQIVARRPIAEAKVVSNQRAEGTRVTGGPD